LQGIGGGITGEAETLDASNKGIHIMLGGLAFQIFSLLLFMCVWTWFILRLRKGLENPVGEKSDADFSNLITSFKFKAFKVGTYSKLESSLS
jgi:hypothetical protein